MSHQLCAKVEFPHIHGFFAVQGSLIISSSGRVWHIDVGREWIKEVMGDLAAMMNDVNKTFNIIQSDKTYGFTRYEYIVLSTGADGELITQKSLIEGVSIKGTPYPCVLRDGTIVLFDSANEYFDNVIVFDPKTEKFRSQSCSGFYPTNPGFNLFTDGKMIAFVNGKGVLLISTFYLLQTDVWHWSSYTCVPVADCEVGSGYLTSSDDHLELTLRRLNSPQWITIRVGGDPFPKQKDESSNVIFKQRSITEHVTNFGLKDLVQRSIQLPFDG
eukprot:TRINITY_DN4556_c0_g1_i2.p1 TRINITY_DN4556_c0_g1~~TRINITY_DN4556_c0_g1_i2.p1  ORF type:complete len:272 (-),score=40.11 TRINITY_DN4556_c0_g1_i2:46-861(-)